jgi:predicted dinucleotide-binding enzyme
MDIAIIGAGNVGGALAGSLTAAGHSVVITSSGTKSALKVALSTGARAAASNTEAVAGAEVVILAVGFPVVQSLAAELGSALDGKVLIDATNAMKPDFSGPLFDAGSAGEAVGAMFPGARVVKAFNTALASRQAIPMVDGVASDGFFAGDDAAAKATVAELLASVGFRPVDVGPLSFSRYLEALAYLNIAMNLRGGAWQSTFKLVGPVPVSAIAA